MTAVEVTWVTRVLQMARQHLQTDLERFSGVRRALLLNQRTVQVSAECGKSPVCYVREYAVIKYWSQWSLLVARLPAAVRRERSQVRIALRTKVCVFTKITAIRSCWHGLHTYCCAVPRSTQPSTLQGTVNGYHLYG